MKKSNQTTFVATENQTRAMLIKYVSSATDLAESVERDLKKGDEYSSKTVLCLSKFVAAAERFRYVWDAIEATQAEQNKTN